MKTRKFETIYRQRFNEMKNNQLINQDQSRITSIDEIGFFDYLMLAIFTDIGFHGDRLTLLKNLRSEYHNYMIDYERQKHQTIKQFYNEIYNRLTEQP